MAAQTTTKPAANTKAPQYTTGCVTSKGGATIGYRQLGQGPALVLLHGANESAQSHMQLAEALAPYYTIFLPDRRGRGMSGPHGADYSSQKEVEDMVALLDKTGAGYVFGVSSGAIVWLQALLSLPSIQKAALYEPPLIVNNSLPVDFLPRYNREIAAGKIVAAAVTGMQGSQMGPPIFNSIPRPLLEKLVDMMMNSEDKHARPGDVTMRALTPTLGYDFQLVIEVSKQQASLKNVAADVLLFGGDKSPAYLKTALRELEQIIPNAQRVEVPGFNHGATGNKNRAGRPEKVAQILRRFFS